MRAPPDYDVVIIGAGPAGSAAAITFKRGLPNLRVALVDKAEFPRDKACGDGLGPGVMGLLRDLDLDEVAISGRRLDTVEVRGPRDAVAVGALPQLQSKSMSGAVIERRRFDERLYRAAIDGGAEDLTGWRFTGSRLEEGSRIADLARGDETRPVSMSLLVGADGAGSRVRASLGVKRNSDRHTGIGIRAYAEVATPAGGPPDRLLLDWDEQLLPGYGWVFPLQDGRANIGAFMVVADIKERTVKPADLLDDYVRQLRARGYTISGVTDSRTYLLPNASWMPKLTAERAALIGDAASMINPWSGEGIFYGMTAGQMVAAATAGELRGTAAALERALRDYERRFRSRFSRHLRSCSVAHRITRSSRLSAGILEAAAGDPKIFDYLAHLMFGEGVLGPRMFTKILARGLWNSMRHAE